MAATEPARQPAWRRYGLRLLWLGFGVLTLWLVAQIVRETDWRLVGDALRSRTPATLALIALAALCSHALYGLLDVLGARALKLALPRHRVWLTATSSYACNLNLGSLVGAAALRFKLYGRQGVAVADVSRLIAMSMASNWLGYLLLLASLPLWASSHALARWTGPVAALAISVAAAVVVALYGYACAKRKTWTVRGHEFRFPPARVALAQLGVGAANWALMGGVLTLCLGDGVAYAQALTALLVAAIAGAVTHVPGGWGVLDYVILKSFAGSLDAPLVVAGVLVYRAAYYLLPLLLAPLSILWLLRGTRADATEPAAAHS
jgi:glycosyltransferase 2 family protein